MIPGDAAAPRGALDGLRVVELASDRAAFAGKMLADLGAEVILVEPPGGHPSRDFEPFLDDAPDRERSLWWWFYNTGKLGVTLDLDQPEGIASWAELVESSDVVLESEPEGSLDALGVGYDRFERSAPDLVWVSVTPFGATSRAGEPTTDLTLQAGGGPAWSCGYDDHTLPPVRLGGDQGYHTASVWAVMGTLTALRVRPRVGGQRVDVNMYAAVNVTTEAATYEWLVARSTVQRQTLRHATPRTTPVRISKSADGHYVVGGIPRAGHEFKAIADWVDELGMAGEIEDVVLLQMGAERGGIRLPEMESDPLAAQIFQAGITAMRQLAASMPAKEFFLGAQTRGLAVGPVLALEDIVEDEHLAARGFPVRIEHEDLGRSFVYPGAPFRAPASPWRIRSRAPHVGEHNEAVFGASPR